MALLCVRPILHGPLVHASWCPGWERRNSLRWTSPRFPTNRRTDCDAPRAGAPATDMARDMPDDGKGKGPHVLAIVMNECVAEEKRRKTTWTKPEERRTGQLGAHGRGAVRRETWKQRARLTQVQTLKMRVSRTSHAYQVYRGLVPLLPARAGEQIGADFPARETPRSPPIGQLWRNALVSQRTSDGTHNFRGIRTRRR